MEPLKMTLFVAGVGGTGLGTYGLYSYGVFSSSKKESVGTRLENEKFKLLNDSHIEAWRTSVSKYNSKTSSNIDEGRLKGICEDLISKDKTSDSDYKKAKLYCVVPRSVQERLKDLGFGVLKTTGNDEDGDKSKWVKLSDSYVTKGIGENQIESLTLTLTLTLTAQNSDSNNWSSLRENCKTILEKDHWEDKFESYFSKSKMWCTLEAFSAL